METAIGTETDRALKAAGLSLIISNIALQFLDWITSFEGYYRGVNEVNLLMLGTIRLFGNEYIGLSIIKVSYIGMLVSIYFFLGALSITGGRTVRQGGLILLNFSLLFLVFVYASAVSNNLGVLGF